MTDDQDLSLLNLALELCWQIERCGSSEDLTKASVLANDLRKRLERYFVGERESRLLHERGIDPNLGKYGCNPLGKCTPPRCPDCPELTPGYNE